MKQVLCTFLRKGQLSGREKVLTRELPITSNTRTDRVLTGSGVCQGKRPWDCGYVRKRKGTKEPGSLAEIPGAQPPITVN